MSEHGKGDGMSLARLGYTKSCGFSALDFPVIGPLMFILK